MNTKEIKLINRLIENHSYQYALNTIESIISKGNDKEAFIFGIYLLHHIILFDNYSQQDEEMAKNKLLYYYKSSSMIFGEDPDYLFIIGFIMLTGSNLFNNRYYYTNYKKSLSSFMIQSSLKKQPYNTIFLWGSFFVKGDTISSYIARYIYDSHHIINDFISKWGVVAKYIIYEYLERDMLIDKTGNAFTHTIIYLRLLYYRYFRHCPEVCVNGKSGKSITLTSQSNGISRYWQPPFWRSC